MFGEEISDTSPSASTTAPGTSEKKKPSFPLTLFERLVNVSDSDNLVFAGDRIGRYAHHILTFSWLCQISHLFFMGLL